MPKREQDDEEEKERIKKAKKLEYNGETHDIEVLNVKMTEHGYMIEINVKDNN
jgi:hypothetical protein